MKNTKLYLIIIIFLMSAGVTRAQSTTGFEDYLKGGIDDANLLFDHYMTPFMKGMGYGFNNGWYNTAKPHETFGFDITFSLNAAIVPEIDQSFLFDENDYTATRLGSGAATATLPTLMGGNTTEILENFIEDPFNPGSEIVAEYPAPDGIGDDMEAYTFNQIAVPSPIIQAGFGLVKGTELKIRWMPTVNNDEFNFKYFGIGGLHSLSQWLPVFKDLPIDISAFLAWTTISAEYAIPAGNIPGTGQRATFDVNTFTYQLIASAKLSVLTGYVGLGMDNFKTNFKMLGSYDISPVPGIPIVLEDPIELEQSGTGGFRTTMGVRVKLAIITLHADYTFREYNTLNVGLGFSIR